MKKSMAAIGLAVGLLCAGVAMASTNDICMNSDALANAAWDSGWCGTDAPAPLYAEFEDTLVEPYNDVAETSSMTSAIESGAGAAAQALLLTDSCVTQGDGSAQNPYRIVCTNYGQVLDGLRYVVGVSATDHNLVIACRSTDAGATWSLDGSEAIGTITRLYVYGSDESPEYVGIQKYSGSYGSCAFQDFPNQFTNMIYVNGRSGADAVFGSQYNDSLFGEYVMGYEGADAIQLTISDYVSGYTYYYAHGGPGNDLIYGTNSASWTDYIVGGEDNDTLWGYSGIDYIYGYTGNDIIHGGNDNDLLHGGDGDDTIYGDNGADYLYGDNGADTLYGGADRDNISGGEGDDILDGITGETTAAFDYLYGENGNDRLYDQLTVAGVCDGGSPIPPATGDGCYCNSSTKVSCEYALPAP